MKRQIRTDRLRKLADHLLYGKLGHEKFDFSSYNAGFTDTSGAMNRCGTLGCAVGECPIVWRNEWEFSPISGMPFLIRKPFTTQGSTWEFFGISPQEEDHLFIPESQYTDDFGGEELDEYATKEEVAHNIITFCNLVEAGKIEEAEAYEQD